MLLLGWIWRRLGLGEGRTPKGSRILPLVPLSSPFCLLPSPASVTSPDSLYVLCSIQSPPVQRTPLSFCLRLSDCTRRPRSLAPWVDIGAALEVDLTSLLGAASEGRMHGVRQAICHGRAMNRSMNLRTVLVLEDAAGILSC